MTLPVSGLRRLVQRRCQLVQPQRVSVPPLSVGSASHGIGTRCGSRRGDFRPRR